MAREAEQSWIYDDESAMRYRLVVVQLRGVKAFGKWPDCHSYSRPTELSSGDGVGFGMHVSPRGVSSTVGTGWVASGSIGCDGQPCGKKRFGPAQQTGELLWVVHVLGGSRLGLKGSRRADYSGLGTQARHGSEDGELCPWDTRINERADEMAFYSNWLVRVANTLQTSGVGRTTLLIQFLFCPLAVCNGAKTWGEV